MTRNLKFFGALTYLLLAFSNIALAAPGYIVASNGTGQSGNSFTVPVVLTAGNSNVSSVQFDLTYPSNFSIISSSAGAATVNAVKSVSTSSIPNGTRFFIYGFNSNVFASGSLVNVVIQVAAGTPAGNYGLTLTGLSANGPSGAVVVLGSSSGLLTVSNPALTYPLTGTITLDGIGLSGVRIDASGIGTQFSSASGAFSFGNLQAGTNYVLTPSLAGYQFGPASFSGTINSSTNISFIAYRTTAASYVISGKVTTATSPLVDVTVNGGSLGIRTTDSFGNYSFTGVPLNTVYSLSVSKPGFSFYSNSQSGTVTGNVIANFNAVAGQSLTYTLSGVVTSSGTPVSGVLINGGSLGNRVTGSAGEFSYLGVPVGTNYVLTPSSGSSTFSPAQLSGTLTSNASVSFAVAKQNCVGSSCPRVTYSASGRVTNGGQGLAGVSVRIGRTFATTNANGEFTSTGLTGGVYYPKPVFPGMKFTPFGSRTEIRTNVSGLSFTGVCFKKYQKVVGKRCDYPQHTVSGRVLLNGSPLAGIPVRIGKFFATTDSNGAYRIANVGAGDYFPRAYRSRYNIVAPTGRVLSLTQDTTLDFTATCWNNYSVVNGQCVRAAR